jgi:hypothetical protein
MKHLIIFIIIFCSCNTDRSKMESLLNKRKQYSDSLNNLQKELASEYFIKRDSFDKLRWHYKKLQSSVDVFSALDGKYYDSSKYFESKWFELRDFSKFCKQNKDYNRIDSSFRILNIEINKIEKLNKLK